MVVDILNKNFSELRVAALYNESGFDSFMYHASKNNVIKADFLEYDLRAVVEKDMYSNLLKLEYLDDKIKESIGNKLEALNLYNSISIPTALKEEEYNTAKTYFGSLNLNNETNLFVLEIKEGIQKVELFTAQENTELLTVSSIKLGSEDFDSDRVALIQFGPIETESYTNLEYSKLVDEVKSRKILIVYTTGSEVVVNVAQSCWDNNENANRNKSKYTLRNDDFINSKNYLSLFSDDSCYVEDLRTGTLISSSEKITTTNYFPPILKKKREIAKKNIESQNYNSCVKYNKGDIVYYNGSYWYSISNLNYNSIPSISPKKWMPKLLIDNYYYTTIECKPFIEKEGKKQLIEQNLSTSLIKLKKNATHISIDTEITNSIYKLKSSNINILIGTKLENAVSYTNYDLSIANITGDSVVLKSQKDGLTDTLCNSFLFVEYIEKTDKDFNFKINYYDEDGNILEDKYSDNIYVSVYTGKQAAAKRRLSDIINSTSEQLEEYKDQYLSFKLDNNSDKSYTFEFNVNNTGLINVEDKTRKTTTLIDNVIDIYVKKPKYIVKVEDESGVFETSKSYYIVEHNGKISFEFYVSKEFDTNDVDDYNYILNSIRVSDGKSSKTYLYNDSSINSVLDNTTSFNLCKETLEERPEREVYRFTLLDIKSNYTITLIAQKR